MRLFRRLAATVPILVAVGLLLAPAAAADPGFSTSPRIVEHPPAGSPKLVDLRAGRHATFDRVVFQIDGPIPWYSIRYVPVVRMDGSGDPLSLRGSAFLEVVLRAATDDDGRPVLTLTPSSGPVGTEVTVEGQGCAPGSATTRLVMQNGGSGTDGMAGLGEFGNDDQGRFRATVTIPDRLDQRQGSPGGPAPPGDHAIRPLPPG